MFFETVIDKATKVEYEVKANKTGENPQPCPVCSQDRKKKNNPCMSYNAQTGLGHCSHCGASFYRKDENYKTYVRPVWENKTDLPEKIVEWFNKRNISQQTLIDMKISWSIEYFAQVQAERNAICFNYFREGILINTKFRDPEKNFKLVKDAEKIFYNIDGIKNQTEIYIVEGEMDCLTMIQAGYTNTVSVPNGATTGNNNLDYFDNCYRYFENATKVYIVTDHDEPGEKLGQELARRIGVEKCFRIALGEFKDVNEQLCQSGKLDLTAVTPYPIEGVFSVTDHWDAMTLLLKNGFPKGWQPRGELGNKVSFHPGYTTVITGIPGHGKSELLDQIVMQISIDYKLKGGYFSPETWPTELHLLKIIEKLMGKSAFKCSEFELKRAKEFLKEMLYWIYPEEGFSIESILNKVRQAVLKYGIRWFVFDPWNKIEHKRGALSETDYISSTLDLISTFNKKNGTHAFIVAHPTKMKMIDGKYEVPGLYDISGSAAWYNKADIGLSMYKEENCQNTLTIQKVKFKFWGEVGLVKFTWNPTNGRYDESGIDLTYWIPEQKKEPELIDFSQSRVTAAYRDDDETPF
jgi:twinkle protein